MALDYEIVKKHIKKLGFDIDIESYPRLKRAIEYYAQKEDIDGLENYMKQLQNCGGYALQIPICIFAGRTYTFEEQVLRITELYPFVRLLADTEINKNEYVVLFRSGETGHHFIRIDEKGNKYEKCESNLPRKFEGWRTLENDQQAIFAVVKQEYRSSEIKDLPQCNGDILLNEDLYYEVENGYRDIYRKKANKPITFKDKIQEAYQNKKSTFFYQGKPFYLKIDKDDSELIYICNDNEILGEFYTDGSEFMIELIEEKKNKIFSYEPSDNLKKKYEEEIDR